MRPFKSTISLEEARRRIDATVRPIVRTERVPLASAHGRVASADVTSPADVPPFARSAMDGYAVVAADTARATRERPVRLRMVDRIFTGQQPSIPMTSGSCAEIATGAPLPPGADAVIMVEDTSTSPAETGIVQLFSSVAAGQNVGRRGGDIQTGDRVVTCGELLMPARIGALAAIGRADVQVFERPVVAIRSTGNEVMDAGGSLAPGQIFDVNRFTLAAIAEAHGCVPRTGPPVPDTHEALVAAIDESSWADVLVFSGGSSVGDRDLLVDAIARRGEMIFHGIAVRPGKPTAFALIEGRPFFGMPGNPTSCLSNAYVLLVPLLRALARLPPFAPRRLLLPLGARIVSAVGRHQFYTVQVRQGVAYPAFKGSGDITSLSKADGYIEIPASESTVEEGAVVDVNLF